MSAEKSPPGASVRARRSYRGPAILREGFRPFFLGAALWSAAALLLWLGVLTAGWRLPSAFDPVTWHAHEMIFGYLIAAVAGFLLTAVPNWTGRLPVRGLPLASLFALWLAGRLAVAVSAHLDAIVVAVIDVGFPLLLCGLVAREIAAGRNWRNLPVAAVLGLLAAASLLSHLEALGAALGTALGLRLGAATVLLLIALIGGRIVPSFTRNWLHKRQAPALPAAFGLFDRLALAVTLLAVLAWVAAPQWQGTGVACLLAAAANGLRLARWRGWRTLAEPLVWVLHLGYAWLVLGLALLGAALLAPGLPASAALHALTAGAMGTMTLAVMTRASLGHSGRPLAAGPGTTSVYLLVTAAAVLRVAASSGMVGGDTLLFLAGLFWIGAFALFALLYGPMLVTPRLQGGDS